MVAQRLHLAAVPTELKSKRKIATYQASVLLASGRRQLLLGRTVILVSASAVWAAVVMIDLSCLESCSNNMLVKHTLEVYYGLVGVEPVMPQSVLYLLVGKIVCFTHGSSDL